MKSFMNSPSVQAYIATLKPKTNAVDTTSLCSLLTRKFTQSTYIRIGNEIENIINIYANVDMKAEDLRPKKVAKGGYQLDFLRRIKEYVVYGEFKANIKLDTEKRKSTWKKVLEIGKMLFEQHGYDKVKPFLVSLRYLRTSEIPPCLSAMYTEVTLIGIADFFETVLETPMEELQNYSQYVKMLMTIADKLEPKEDEEELVVLDD
jgi:hypothetical protein